MLPAPGHLPTAGKLNRCTCPSIDCKLNETVGSAPVHGDARLRHDWRPYDGQGGSGVPFERIELDADSVLVAATVGVTSVAWVVATRNARQLVRHSFQGESPACCLLSNRREFPVDLGTHGTERWQQVVANAISEVSPGSVAWVLQPLDSVCHSVLEYFVTPDGEERPPH